MYNVKGVTDSSGNYHPALQFPSAEASYIFPLIVFGFMPCDRNVVFYLPGTHNAHGIQFQPQQEALYLLLQNTVDPRATGEPEVSVGVGGKTQK